MTKMFYHLIALSITFIFAANSEKQSKLKELGEGSEPKKDSLPQCSGPSQCIFSFTRIRGDKHRVHLCIVKNITERIDKVIIKEYMALTSDQDLNIEKKQSNDELIAYIYHCHYIYFNITKRYVVELHGLDGKIYATSNPWKYDLYEDKIIFWN